MIKTKKYPKYLNNLSLKKSIQNTNFIGSAEDLIFSLFYLRKKHKNFYFPLGDIKNYNIDLMWNICISLKCNTKKKLKLFLPENEKSYFNKINYYIKNYKSNKKRQFVLIPIYLGSDNCDIQKGHFNILIFNLQTMIIERFEPYGKQLHIKQHIIFDKNIKSLFKKHKINVIIKTHKDFMSKKSFQTLDEQEINNNISSLRNTDPGGFCIVWGIWFCNMKLKYPDISSKELIIKTENILKKKKPFRNFIRNYSQYLIQERKKVLGMSLKYFSKKTISKKIISLSK